jgi:hypothetical protein
MLPQSLASYLDASAGGVVPILFTLWRSVSWMRRIAALCNPQHVRITHAIEQCQRCQSILLRTSTGPAAAITHIFASLQAAT